MIIDPYAWSQSTITSVQRVTFETVAIKIEKPLGYIYRPGQYVIVRGMTTRGESFVRQYSLVSDPLDGYLELLVQLEAGGTASQWLCQDARAGDVVDVSRALGNFVIDKDSGRPLLIAGKVGIAPFLQTLKKPPYPITTIYSVKTLDQVCYPDLMEKAGVHIVETSKSTRISSSMLQQYVPTHDSYYVCGSKQFVDSMSGYLQELGVDKQHVHRESFTLQ